EPLPGPEDLPDPVQHRLGREVLQPVDLLPLAEPLVDRPVVQRDAGLVLLETEVVTHAMSPVGSSQKLGQTWTCRSWPLTRPSRPAVAGRSPVPPFPGPAALAPG